MKKVYIETHGCQMNVHDSEKAAFSLQSAGYEQTLDPLTADLVMLNTCMVREKPEQKVFRRIAGIKHDQKKMNGKIADFGVMGCVAQAEAERIFDRSPDVKIVIGTQSIGKLPDLLTQLEQGFDRVIDVDLTRDAEFFELDVNARKTAHVALVTITEGCNKFCSYCIVPFTRGRERSRTAESILLEAQSLAAQGFKEIHLLGQNVNSYGLSGKYRGNIPGSSAPLLNNEATFSQLLELLAKESGIPRIKYSTSYPRDFDQEVIRVMDNHENLCEWIHLPAQSGSDRILKRMRRGYSAAEYLKKIEIIRSAQKEYSITGDIIIGFPGETEEDFLETMRLVAEVEFDGLFLFNYSARPKTAAMAYEDSIPESLKTERLMRVQELQGRIQVKNNERYLGRMEEVLIDGISSKSQDDFSGYSKAHKKINFPKSDAKLGEIVKVLITKSGKNSLYGEIVK
jgi:tRNA-2-methylthio-N6-dimethylallyladenosine synthase